MTSFFNGGREAPNEGEDRFLIPSPQVATYDLQPEMSAQAVCDTLIDKIRSGEYDVIVANFANSDMVGHTGVEKAAVEAVECLDECIGRVVETIREVDGQRPRSALQQSTTADESSRIDTSESEKCPSKRRRPVPPHAKSHGL